MLRISQGLTKSHIRTSDLHWKRRTSWRIAAPRHRSTLLLSTPPRLARRIRKKRQFRERVRLLTLLACPAPFARSDERRSAVPVMTALASAVRSTLVLTLVLAAARASSFAAD